MSDDRQPSFRIAAALRHVLHAHDKDSIAWVMAARLLVDLSNDDLNPSVAMVILDIAAPVYLDRWMFTFLSDEPPKRERVELLVHAVEIATLSGQVTPHEQILLEALAHRLRLTKSELRQAIDYYEDKSQDDDEEDDSKESLLGSETMSRSLVRGELVFGVASVLRQILQAHEADSRERLHAASILSELEDGEVSIRAAMRLLDTVTDADFPSPEFLESVSLESRLFPLNLAVDIALVDGRVTGFERRLLEQLARRLLLPEWSLDRVLASRSGGTAGYDSRRSVSLDDIRAAYELLGIPAGSDIAVIRTAHRRLIRENHPDIYPESEREAATRRSSAINAAYDLLIGAA